jgi:hypothetical protein
MLKLALVNTGPTNFARVLLTATEGRLNLHSSLVVLSRAVTLETLYGRSEELGPADTVGVVAIFASYD